MLTICKTCGKEISVKKAAFERGEGKYCSNVCYNKSRQIPPVKCKVCGKEFRLSPAQVKRGEGKYCSRECDGKSRQAPWWTHPENKDAAIETVRIAIREGKLTRLPCIACGDENSEAHHQDYNEPLEVMWLCQSHHIAWHKMINGY